MDLCNNSYIKIVNDNYMKLINLEDGWLDGKEGKAITVEAQDRFKTFLHILFSIWHEKLYLYPTINGGFQLEFENIHIYIEPDGKIDWEYIGE